MDISLSEDVVEEFGGVGKERATGTTCDYLNNNNNNNKDNNKKILIRTTFSWLWDLRWHLSLYTVFIPLLSQSQVSIILCLS